MKWLVRIVAAADVSWFDTSLSLISKAGIHVPLQIY